MTKPRFQLHPHQEATNRKVILKQSSSVYSMYHRESVVMKMYQEEICVRSNLVSTVVGKET